MFRPPPRITSGLPAATAAVFVTLSMQVPACTDDVYLCAGPNGVSEYRNSDNVEGCKRLTLPDVMTVPGTHSPRSMGAAPAPVQNNAGGGFPRVGNVTQKTCDSERCRVLEAELADEECRLQALKAEYNSGQPERQDNGRDYRKYLGHTVQLEGDIECSQANVDSIRRELSDLKKQVSYASTDLQNGTP